MKKLIEVLNNYCLEDLNNSLTLYNVNKKFDKESDVKDTLSNKILNKKILENKIKTLLPNEINLLKILINNNGVYTFNTDDIYDCIYLEKLMLLDLELKDNDVNVSLESDVYEILKTINIDECDKSKENEIIYKLLKNMINLYGLISFDELCDAYKLYYNKDLLINDALINLDQREDEFTYFEKDDVEYFMGCEMIEDTGLFDLLIQRKKEIPKKEISLEELQLIGDDNYIPNCTETDNMKKLLISLKNKNIKNDIDYIMSYIYETTRHSVNYFIDVVNLIASYGVKNINDYLESLALCYFNFYKKGYLWINNGYQNGEFIEKFKDKNIDEFVMPSSNEEDK